MREIRAEHQTRVYTIHCLFPQWFYKSYMMIGTKTIIPHVPKTMILKVGRVKGLKWK